MDQSAHPNPFNATTSISVTLPNRSELTVQVYNIAGQRVAEFGNGLYPGGLHKFIFDGSELASGIYFIRAFTDQRWSGVENMILVK